MAKIKGVLVYLSEDTDEQRQMMMAEKIRGCVGMDDEVVEIVMHNPKSLYPVIDKEELLASSGKQGNDNRR